MDESQVDQPNVDQPRIFAARSPIGLQSALLIGGGVLFLGILFVVFLLELILSSSPGTDRLPGVIGAVSVFGFGLIARGVLLLWKTRSVLLNADGVCLRSSLSQRFVPWEKVSRVERDKKPSSGGITVPVIHLIASNGKRLATVADTIKDFDDLTAELAARSALRTGHTTFDPVADQQRYVVREMKRGRRNAWIFAVMTLGMAAGLFVGINEELHNRRYATEGIRTEAHIVRQYKLNVTSRVEYSFQDARGQTFTRDVKMYGPDWAALSGSQTVSIEYLPSDPSYSRLLSGENAGASLGGGYIVLSALATIMFGAFFVVMLLGYDLKIEDGVNVLTRHGEVIKTWGVKRKNR